MEARVVPAFLVRESGGIALTELSNELIFDLSALSKAAGRLESIMKTDIRLVDRVESIREEVSLKRICDK